VDGPGVQDGRELLELTGAGDHNSFLEDISAKRHSVSITTADDGVDLLFICVLNG
jgi:hypothetical protein